MMLQVEEYGQVFMEHANKLVEVANLACSMSSNEEGVKLVRLAATQLETLCPQVRVTAVLRSNFSVAVICTVHVCICNIH